MQFTLNKTNLAVVAAAFRKDRLATGLRKRKHHGLDRFWGQFEAGDGLFRVKSGRLDLAVRAHVVISGTFALRDAKFRQLLDSLRGEPKLDVTAAQGGLFVNGSFLTLSEHDYEFIGNALGAERVHRN